jgi:general secretion pathway protein H
MVRPAAKATMPTLAPGISKGMKGECVKGEGRGFTLIEMLVVLLIMGLFVGLVSAIARPDERGLLHVEAERLAQLLDLAAQESRLTGKSIGWTSDGPGYRFWRLREDTGWSEIRDNDTLRARALPQGMTISGLRVENMRGQGAMRLEFTPYGPTLSYTIEISLGAERYFVAGSPVGDVRALPIERKTNDKMALR